MKSHRFLHHTLALAILAGASAAYADATPRTLVDETFADGVRNGQGRAVQWFASTSYSTLSYLTVAAAPVGSGISGKALSFYSTSFSSRIGAVFAPVTLAEVGDYIEASLKVAYDADKIGSNTTSGPQLGLYNTNDTPLVSDTINTTLGSTAFGNDIGYAVTKYALVDANDLFIHASLSAVSPNLLKDSTGKIVNTDTSRTLSIRIELLNTNSTDNVLITATWDGVAKSVIATANTLTFDEVFLAVNNGAGLSASYPAYIGEIQVLTNVIPEPATVAWILGLSVFPLLAFRICRR
ncbi:MAG: hypothetical protein LBK99_18955 [Opitutaceae bacterium]|jgi:hypothetical protein|nr:hypothetical protein [Opitutaceae bacterium]